MGRISARTEWGIALTVTCLHGLGLTLGEEVFAQLETWLAAS